MEISYRQYKPSAALAPYVHSYWFLGDENQLASGQIFYKKCIPLGFVGVIIPISDEKQSYLDAQAWIVHDVPYLIGIWTEKATVKIPPRATCFGISLRPERLSELLSMPVGEIQNKVVDADWVFGKSFHEFSEKTIAAQTDAERVVLCENFLKARLSERRRMDGFMTEAIHCIHQSGGNLTVEALSRQVFICRRQLERRFKETLGVSPKMYGRLSRFSKAFSMMQGNPSSTWLDVSYSCGYADQAHLIRDFKAFTGEAPTVFFNDEPALSVQPKLVLDY